LILQEYFHICDRIYLHYQRDETYFSRHMPVFFIFKGLRREMIVRFVNIEGIFDHHCLNYHFIINTLVVYWLIISRILRKWKR